VTFALPVLTALLATGGGVPQAPPTFSAAVEVVRLDVSVTRDGLPVKNLQASDFEVLDEGVPQAVQLVAQDETAVDAVLALDISSSVAGEKLSELKAAAHRFVDALRPDDTLSLLTFSECIDLVALQSRSRAEAHASVALAQARNTTSLRDTALAALTLADPSSGRPLVLVFSDGEDVGSFVSPESVVGLARESEVVVHAVVPSGPEVPGFLPDLTAETGGRTWQVGEGDRLGDIFVRALEEFRSRYRLQFEPRGVKPGGWHRLRVRLKSAPGKVYARRGYIHRGGG
jgi:VWFA-related protein